MDPGQPGSSALRSARQTIRRRRKLILLTFALILLGDIIGTYAMTPLWRGEARILVLPGPLHEFVPFSTVDRQPPPVKPTISTEDAVQLLGSRELAVELVKRFSLDTAKPPGGLRGALQAMGKATVSAPGRLIGVVTGSKRLQLGPVDEAVESLQDLEDVSESKDTSIVNVGVYAGSPQLANSLANALAAALIREDGAASRREAERAYLFTARELERAETRLDEAQGKLKEFKERQHFADPQQDLAVMSSRLEALRKDLDSTKAELASTETRLGETRTQLAGQKETITAAKVVAANPVVAQLRSDLVKLETDLAGELQRKQEAHPDVQRLRAQIRQNTERRRSEIERILDTETISMNPVHQELLQESLTFDAQAQGLRAREHVQTIAVEAARRDVDGLAAKSVEFDRRNREVEAASGVARDLRVGAQELDALRRTDIGLGGTRIRLAERSALPNEASKDSPKWLVNLGVGLIAGLLLSLSLAFFLEYWREGPEPGYRAQEQQH